jgi:hypothetical protein
VIGNEVIALYIYIGRPFSRKFCVLTQNHLAPVSPSHTFCSGYSITMRSQFLKRAALGRLHPVGSGASRATLSACFTLLIIVQALAQDVFTPAPLPPASHPTLGIQYQAAPNPNQSISPAVRRLKDQILLIRDRCRRLSQASGDRQVKRMKERSRHLRIPTSRMIRTCRRRKNKSM